MALTLNALHSRIQPVKGEPALGGVLMDLYQSNAMQGESGEVGNIVKKMVRDGETRELDDKMIDECGDVLFYMSRLLRRRGFTLEDAAIALLTKLDDQASESERLQKLGRCDAITMNNIQCELATDHAGMHQNSDHFWE